MFLPLLYRKKVPQTLISRYKSMMPAPFIFLVILDNWSTDMILCGKEDKNMCVFYAKSIFSESNIGSHA